MMISLQRLQEVLDYDRATGVFTWKQKIGRRSAGAAGTVMFDGYRRIGIDGKQYRAHDLAWLWERGLMPDFLLDHRNRNRDDNSIDNLRQASQSQNLANTEKRSNNTSGYKGVSKLRGREKWIATIKVLGRSKYLGTFDSPSVAHVAYSSAMKNAFGDFARTS